MTQHGNMLTESVPDTVALAVAVHERFCRLIGDHVRIRGADMPIPAHLKQDVIRWREMMTRHQLGDLRNTEAELASTRAVAQFTLDMNCELRNQPKQKLQWT